ncbi:MAG: hypothetical protein HY816_10570 [Candidatus Wallbacteria bacterium]|nr:hypothetical protein [Candidatus Wallbacteria bacterium]
MALTRFQRELCRLIAANRRQGGESYVAGGVALNELIGGRRISRDLDLFHDTDEALRVSWAGDRALLEASGLHVDVLRESPSFVEAMVSRSPSEGLLVQWVRDSAYRFFPLVEDELFGLVLHPFDLATNKVLALVGRLEPRDWIDTVESDARVQPLGYLAWAACGKDPGFGPAALLAEARRSGRYSQVELDELAFDGERPDAGELGGRWRQILAEADRAIGRLPPDQVGRVVLASGGELYRGTAEALERELAAGRIDFHPGRIRGIWPAIRPLK